MDVRLSSTLPSFNSLTSTADCRKTCAYKKNYFYWATFSRQTQSRFTNPTSGYPVHFFSQIQTANYFLIKSYRDSPENDILLYLFDKLAVSVDGMTGYYGVRCCQSTLFFVHNSCKRSVGLVPPERRQFYAYRRSDM